MLFTSATFLFYFLPIVLIINWCSPKSFRNYTLLISSLVFYIWGEGEFVILMLTSIVINYIFGVLIYDSKSNSNLYLAIGVIINILLLTYFKYFNFLTLQFGIETKPIHLAVGISFFTFQGLSYLVDVSRNHKLYQSNITKLGLYISLFPQLIAGPIVRYSDVADQIDNREESNTLFYSGVLRFVSGLCKKMIIANPLALIADQIFDQTDYNLLPTSIAWLGLICYALQICFLAFRFSVISQVIPIWQLDLVECLVLSS